MMAPWKREWSTQTEHKHDIEWTQGYTETDKTRSTHARVSTHVGEGPGLRGQHEPDMHHKACALVQIPSSTYMSWIDGYLSTPGIFSVVSWLRSKCLHRKDACSASQIKTFLTDKWLFCHSPAWYSIEEPHILPMTKHDFRKIKTVHCMFKGSILPVP